MKTFLVPTDFSDTAKNAARYAISFAENIPGSRVVIFNTYDKHAYGSDGTPLHVNEDNERHIAIAALNNHRADLLSGGANVTVEVMAHAGDLNEQVQQAVDELNADLIIMGINYSNPLDQFLVGSATLRMIKRHICPVLIVPEKVEYAPINKIAFASDLERIDESTPVALLCDLCNTFDTNLNVVHNGGFKDPEDQAKLAQKLEECQPAFHFMNGNDFAGSINDFVESKEINLLVMVPRQHDFFENLFKKSHTQILAYKSTVPVIAVHESLCSVPVN